MSSREEMRLDSAASLPWSPSEAESPDIRVDQVRTNAANCRCTAVAFACSNGSMVGWLSRG